MALWELKAKGGNILWKIESVCKMIEWGDFDKDNGNAWGNLRDEISQGSQEGGNPEKKG